MPRRTSVLAKYKHLLEVDPESLESILPRTQVSPEEPGEETQLQPAEWERLTQILKHELDRIADPQSRLLAIEHVGEIYEVQLADQARAFRWWAQVLAGQPFVEEACAELERLARDKRDWGRVVQVFRTAVGKLQPAAQRYVQLREARIYLEETGEAAKAERIFLTVWQRDRQDLETLRTLESFYIQTGRQDELIKILRQRVDLAETTDERIELRLRLGYLYEVEQGEPELAAECYRQVLRDDRANRQALEALEQIYLRGERWLDLLSTYERMAAGAPDEEERVGYLVRMARICDDTLNDRGRSRELWHRIREARGNDQALLAEMAQRFEAMQRWEELVEVLARQVQTERDPGARMRLYERQGQILGDKLVDRRRALESWSKVLDADPGNVQALLALCDLYGGLEAWQELLATLEQLTAIATREGREPAFLKELYAQVATVEADKLGRVDAAVEAWRRVQELDPADGEALAALEALLSKAARWKESVEVLERRLLLLDGDEEQVQLLLRQAEIWRDGLEDTEGAIRAYRRVLEFDPTNEAAHEALCALYRGRAQWDLMVAQVFAWLETVEDRRLAVKLMQEAAVAYEEQLEQPEQAFTVWQATFRRDPTNEVTTSNLERLAATLGRWTELLAVYEEGLRATQSAPLKVGLLVSMARCHGLELGQTDRAVALLHEALHMDPEAIPALEVLEECYRRAARWAELVPVLKRHADLERDGGRVVELLNGMAELQSRLGDPGQAMVTYQKVLEIDPTHLGALSALEALYLAWGMWEPLVEVLQRQLQLTTDPRRIVAIKTHIGEIYDQQLGNPERAIQSFEAALELDPESPDALAALESLYDRTDRSEAYLDVLERKLDLSQDAEERSTMYPRVAAAWEEQFSRPDRAIGALEKLLQVEPASPTAHLELERLHRTAGDHAKLAAALRRHAEATADPAERVELLLSLAELLEGTLLDAEQAIGVHREVLAIDGEETRALEGQARLHEKLGQWEPAVRVLERLVPLLQQPERRAGALFRLGRIHESELVDAELAERRYLQALELHPHFDAMTRLVELYKARKDWARAAEMMVRAEPHTSNQAKKAQLLHEAGMIHLGHLGDEARAVELLARTLEIDPDHHNAGLPLSQIYFRDGRYAELEPVLDMLARKVDPRDKGTRHDVYFKLGKTAAALGKVEKAVRCYRDARGINTTHLPTLQALSDLQYQTEDWPEAFKTYQTILVHHRPALQPEEVVEVFHRLGDIKAHQAEWRKSLNYYEKALEENPSHRASLKALVEVQTRFKNWEAVTRAKTALLAGASREEQFQLLRDCGALYHDKLNDGQKAVEAYHAAVALKPDDRVLLNEFLELLTVRERWPDVLQIILRLTELEEHPEIRARFFYTAAVICRDRLGQPDQALHLFNEALDAAPAQLKAFEAVDRLCTASKDWQALERSYRRMISRLPEQGETELKIMLLHNLGEVYRTRLKRLPDAIKAFEGASRLEPDNLERHTILAELYQAAGPEHAAKAIAEHQILIARDPSRVASYRALHQLHAQAGDVDGAWCIAGALVFLKQADEQARRFYGQLRRPSPRRAQAPVSDALWSQCILHPKQERQIDAIFDAVAPVLMQLLARPAKDFGLKRRERIKAGAATPMVDIFHYLAWALGGIAADLYLKRDQQAPMMMANTEGAPSIVVNEQLWGNPVEKQLAFTLGQQLTYLRPGYFLCRLFPSPTHLRMVMLAILKLAHPTLPLRPDASTHEVERLVQQLAEPVHMRPGLLQQLGALGQPLLGGAAGLDLTPWWNHVGLTANRVGFLFCDDLEVAAGVIQSEPSPFGTMPASEKIKELVAYSVSPAYLHVRRQLGIRVEV